MKLCVGNWKMNCNLKHIEKFRSCGVDKKYENVELVVALPHPYLHCEIQKHIKKAGQDCSIYNNGAHTGEVGADMINEFGVKYVIVGHSERRKEESLDSIILKIDNALNSKLKVILCVGENTGEDVLETIKKQLTGIKMNENIIIAYEPVWAIGTGQAATKIDVKNAVDLIKKETEGLVLYGGSVNALNCSDLSSVCDGFLIGNASLTEDFFVIADCLEK